MKNILHSPVRVISRAWKKQTAFSLVEMLMALLVASLLMAALAPVMTRKMNEHIQISNTANIKTPYDLQCYPYTDANPSIDIPLNNVYYANFIIASAGGGGAGATSSKKIAQTPIQITGTSNNDTTQEITITEYMTDVKATLAGGGGGGAGGAGYVSACPSNTMEFKGNNSVKSFCMTKYNVGERNNIFQNLNYDYIPERITGGISGTPFYLHDTKGSEYCPGNGKTPARCYYYAFYNSYETIYTSVAGYCTNSGYNACTRTVSQYDAALNACAAFKYVPNNVPSAYWSLPNVKQAEVLKVQSASVLGTGGLGLCSDIGTGGYRCLQRGDMCYGAESTHGSGCYPSAFWLLTPSGVTPGYAYHMWFNARLEGGAAETPYARAFSARCTLDKTSLFKSYSGAGGAAGAYISELDLTGYVKQAGINGKIIITAGKEGKGGNAASSNNTKANDGTNGNPSQIIIKKQTGETVYGIKVKGGNGGKAAENITVSGTAAINPNISTSKNCEETTDGINWKETSCTKNILKAGNGEIKWKESAPKGAASISPITSNTSGNGAGGEGGTSSYGYNDKVSAENGTNGKPGLVKITYSNEYAAAGGGGGGAGSVVQIKNIYVGNKAECKLTIGKGGKGGSIDNNGMDGSLSSVKCDNDARTFSVNGGKGGKKGTASNAANTAPAGGNKGEFGDANTYIYALDPEKRVIKKGLDGINGGYDDANRYSTGGRGGTSGTGTKGACGGLYTETGICEVSDTDANRTNGKGFEYADVVTPLTKDIQNEASPSFGKAAAGGGGGGWIRELGSGRGGDGMNGYVCVYWYGDDE